MHAASVHPEPGSNSLKIVYQSEASLPNVITFIRVISMLYYYLRAFVNSKEFSESFLVHCCSIFNERFPFARRRSRRQPVYYITSARLCQEVFQNFFKFFRSLFLRFASAIVVSFVTTLLLYHIRFRLSRGFSNFFEVFFKPACRCLL